VLRCEVQPSTDTPNTLTEDAEGDDEEGGNTDDTGLNAEGDVETGLLSPGKVDCARKRKSVAVEEWGEEREGRRDGRKGRKGEKTHSNRPRNQRWS
jgi:hypothetical protein